MATAVPETALSAAQIWYRQLCDEEYDEIWRRMWSKESMQPSSDLERRVWELVAIRKFAVVCSIEDDGWCKFRSPDPLLPCRKRAARGQLGAVVTDPIEQEFHHVDRQPLFHIHDYRHAADPICRNSKLELYMREVAKCEVICGHHHTGLHTLRQQPRRSAAGDYMTDS